VPRAESRVERLSKNGLLVPRFHVVRISLFAASRVCYRFLIAMQRTDLVFYCGAATTAR